MINVNGMRGVVPRDNPKTLDGREAESAQDADIRHKDVRAFLKKLQVVKPSKVGIQNTIHRFGASPNKDAKGQITNVQLTNPCQITSVGHGRTTGEKVHISEIVGTTELNDATYTITVVDTDNYTLNGVDATLYTAYVSGGVWVYQNGVFLHWVDSEAVDGVSVARTPIDGDTSERTIFTGEGAPKQTYSPIATAGSTDYPDDDFLLGIPAPSSAPSVAVTGTGTGNPTTHAYVFTHVSSLGEEGPPSPVSTIVDVEDGQEVDLTGLGTGPAGDYDITNKRIYRSVAGSTGARFYFVAEIGVLTTSYTDDPKNDLAGSAITTTTYDPPPSDMQGVIPLPNASMAGFSKNQLCLAVPGLPHAWPTKWRLTTESDITGIMNYGTTIVIGTQTNPYIAQGTDPSTMSTRRIRARQACVSRRSMCNVGQVGVVYASPDGLVMISDAGVELITDRFFTRDEWQALNPNSIHCHYWDGRLVFFYQGATEGGYILDISDPNGAWLMPLSFYAQHAYADPLADALYLLINGYVYEFNAGFEKDQYTWKSKLFVQGRPVGYKVAQVIASSYNDTILKVYADGSLIAQKYVINDRPMKFKPGREARNYQFELTSKDQIEQVLIAETAGELAAA